MFRKCGWLALWLLGSPLLGKGQAASDRAPVSAAPLYRVSFEKKDPVSGIDASPAIKLPFECTSDGTMFVTLVPFGVQMKPPFFAPPPLLLVSVSPAGKATTFPLDQATDQLFDVREMDHYVWESGVAFLIKAASENKPENHSYTKPDGSQGEVTRNAAERHSYIVLFSRDGEHKKTMQLDPSFEVQHIGVFPSGSLLAFGYDAKDHSPKMAMLQDDGTLARMLHFGKDEVPESLLGTKDGSGKGAAVYLAPSQLFSQGSSIFLAQNKTSFPLLEISEGGEIRAIHPQLPSEAKIDGLIASDQNLFVRVDPSDEGSIYELNAQTGAVLRRFVLTGRAASSIACVHENKFLSFEHGDGKLIPLVGTAEPAGGTPPPTQNSLPRN